MCKRYQLTDFFYAWLILAGIALAGCQSKEHTTSLPASDSTEVPGSARQQGSIYQVDMSFTNQNGENVPWQSLQGKVRIMAMVFTHCKYACPRITQDMKNIEALIPSRDTGKVAFTLISFDVNRDTPARLKAYAKEMGLDSHWQLLHGSEDDVQTVSALLDVKYKPMEDSLFSHENVITIIDPQGRIVAKQNGLGKAPETLAQTVELLVEKPRE